MNKTKIVYEFANKNFSTKEIAKVHNLNQKYVKSILLDKLGKDNYLSLAHKLGARKVNDRLKDYEYRKDHIEKISESVSYAINKKMKDPSFRASWINKCRMASLRGKQKINSLLETNLKFREDWVKNSKKGGMKTFTLSLGAFNPDNREVRRNGSLRGLKNTKRKVFGPKGEKMYNNFERYIANLILNSNLDYVYEKIFKDKNYNGFISCDFEIKINGKILLVEATCWDKCKEKSIQINEKFKRLKTHITNFEYILVVPTQRQSEKYSEFLDKEIICLSSYNLNSRLKKVAGEGFEFGSKIR